MARTYGGSLLGRQELDGELLSDVPNALWRRQDLDSYRNPAPDRNDFIRIVVGVDPAIGGANETTIFLQKQARSSANMKGCAHTPIMTQLVKSPLALVAI